MRIALLFIGFVLMICGSHAQSLAPRVVSTGGSNFNNGGFNLSSTVGELMVTTESNNGKIITQGFQQGPKIIYNSIKNYDPQISVKVFPNPASDYIYLNIKSTDQFRSCKILLFDVFGQKVEIPVSKESFNSGEQIRLELNSIAKGNYLIRVYDEFDESIYSDIKIIKIR